MTKHVIRDLTELCHQLKLDPDRIRSIAWHEDHWVVEEYGPLPTVDEIIRNGGLIPELKTTTRTISA